MSANLDLMVDMDDVFFPLINSIHDIAHEQGLHDGTEGPTQWEGWKQYNCRQRDYWKLWEIFMEREGYMTTPPIEGAVEALRFLSWEGHRIHIVTARGFFPGSGDLIRAWTPKYLEEFAVPHETLTFSQNKAQAQEVLGVKFDAAVDDSPKNWHVLDDAGVNVYLHDHGHNLAYADIPPERRVSTLWEWAYRVEKLAGSYA